ncbi:MAG: DUF2335 domain-containing protein [Candidatus Magnetominusculus sp. LBB02]|nr:DUF2335 domain-containing protein [Candidatus Magnetominusculus sp. LBB02]
MPKIPKKHNKKRENLPTIPSDSSTIPTTSDNAINSDMPDFLNMADKNQFLMRKEKQITQHIGPLPSPETLDKYEKVLPGLAERIVKRAEDEQKHRHSMAYEEQQIEKNLEKERLRQNELALTAQTNDLKLGKILGFIIVILGFVVSGFCIIYDATVPASIIGGGTLLQIAALFVTGKYGKQNQDLKKEKGKG